MGINFFRKLFGKSDERFIKYPIFLLEMEQIIRQEWSKEQSLEELKKVIGICQNKEDSVQAIKQLRKQLSKEDFDLDYINSL